MENDLEKCFEFILELEKLKDIKRKVKPIGVDRYENSAEHSWQIAVCAMAFADFSNEEINKERVIKMLLVHDIGEIDAGDIIFFDSEGKEAAKEKQLESVKRIFGILPEEKREEFFELWDEFENGDSPEAKFARAIDRVLPILQNVNNDGQSWKENGIDKEQILEKTAYISDGSQELWDSLSAKIEKAFDEPPVTQSSCGQDVRAPTRPMKKITIVCDGSSLGNGSERPRAAACALLGYEGYWRGFAKYLGKATNQQSEIAAAEIGFLQLSEPCEVRVLSDSRYVVETMLGNFRKKTNHEWWDRLEKATAIHDIKWEWVKGHSGHKVQEVADDIARKTAELERVDEEFIDDAVLEIGIEEL